MSKCICPIHGVWEKTPDQPRCPQCSKHTNKVYDKTSRNKESDKFYHSRAWKSVREKAMIRDGMMCQECKRHGTHTQFDVVDHIVEIEDGGCKLCIDNLECLCHSCHNKKTSKVKKERS
ncbi:HNH endonuclease [Sulfurovum mangrovi]|uniref:HNH endonuclease n=1 Tax=Sulfurovum mangrovi TaxID=2893889 RepID=UPI001E58A0D1|nr:HNH endonuclease signature motif containing protein [Sulfurovum mangrovi]UFH59824.1 HNH endonuclease [Sulfurovum mangrovi]UFH59875.1 HNH endonuclease [Sulfurovum mangrovi]